VNDWLTHAFSLICGQHPEHLWAPGDLPLSCCQRCTGLYAGAALAFALHLLFRPPPTTRSRWMHGMFLLQIAPFGFHWVPQGPVLRTVTGALFAFGVVAFLWPPAADLVTQITNLLSRRSLIRRRHGAPTVRQLEIGDPADLKSASRGRNAAYGFGLAATLVLMLAAARWGGRFGFLVLSWLAVLGVLVLAALALTNLGLGVGALLKLLRTKRTLPA